MSNLDALHETLITAATRFDRAQEGKRDYNRYAMAIYFGRIDEAISEIANGKSVARALYDNFNDRLLTVLEKAANVPVTYGGGTQDKGRPT